MFYKIEAGRIEHIQKEEEAQDNIVVIEREEMRKEVQGTDRFDRIIAHVLDNDHLRFEAHHHLDVLCVHLHTDMNKDEQVAMHIFLQKHALWLVSEKSQLLDKRIEKLMQYDVHDWNLGSVLYASMDHFLEEESLRLDRLQDEISELEDEVISLEENDDTIARIIHLRKRLLKQERNFDSMQDVLDHVRLNRNNLLNEQELRSFAMMSSKVGRLSGRVSSLQDYVTEIREAYQAAIDIKLNVTMRIFTVITAVFLPLSLLAGWYGMNLKMPEFQSEHAYVILIVVCIVIVVGLLRYFKKNRWY